MKPSQVDLQAITLHIAQKQLPAASKVYRAAPMFQLFVLTSVERVFDFVTIHWF
jgi:hypothetical protein